MKSNPNARNICIEILLNGAERSTLDGLRGGLGASPFFRSLLHAEARTHGTPPAPPKESRHCRGAGRPASRASIARPMVRRQV
ncbi:hypothetical protein HF313_14990 [Massilia atriviolacea]|uniref:Uncharacterized protein n=1 Tax=Massilia atriviolacea TaxID=2495579 RepID=A0A430HR76_9BURK|nr:hypothetical protein [Massilia atriviolacea]RSZ60018.1 hypothetical protein EJB06_07515 [Massilia atriviolacea]